MKKRRLVIVAAALLVVATAGFGYSRWAASAQDDEQALQTTTIRLGTVSASIDAGGTLSAPQVEAISWGTSGVVGAVRVAVGDTVQAGDILMELDPASLDASMVQARAELLAAEAALADLLDGASASELAQAGLRAANAQDALEEAQRDWTSQ